MKNLEEESWPRLTGAQQRKAAFSWKAGNASQRKEWYKSNGIRWSELCRLPYWDPSRQIMVDVMHNLFLGVIKRHYYELLGMKDSNKQNKPHHTELPPQFDQVRAIRRKLNDHSKEIRWESMLTARWANLYAANVDCGVQPEGHVNDISKEDVLNALKK